MSEMLDLRCDIQDTEGLRQEITRRDKIIRSLMHQVEHSLNAVDTDYALLQNTFVLEEQVRGRTEELKQTLDALEAARTEAEAARSRLAAAVESISEGFALYDPNDRLLLCNDAFKRLWGFQHDILGRCFDELLEEAETMAGEQAPDWLQRRLTAHHAGIGSDEYTLPNGQQVQVRERRTADGYTVGIYADITDIKAQEAQLLQSTIDAMAQGITVIDKDLRLRVWNRRFLELQEFPQSFGVRGKTFASLIRYNAERGEYGPGNIDELVEQRVNLARRNEPHHFERERPNGTIIEIVGKPMSDGGFVTTYTDVTQHRRAESELRRAYDELELRVNERTRALRESQERFRDLAESASDWFWEMDESLRFTYLSDRFYEVSHLKPEDVVGKHRWELPGADGSGGNPGKWPRYREDLQNRLPLRGFEYSIEADDGSAFHIRVTGKPFYDEQGGFLGYRGTGSNITELVGAQNELLRSEKLAALGGLVAGVAHEINTPIGISLTAASYLEEQTQKFERIYASGQVRRSEMESFARTAAESSSALVTNLRRAAELVRSFKQVAVDQSSEQKRHFNLKECLDEIMLSLHPKLKRTKHEVSIDCPESLSLDSFPGAFSQIIANLVMNSLIHGFENRDKGHIEIKARVDGEVLTLIYRDDGKGIPAEYASRIFEPFFTTRRGQGGSGLGMHVVYNLVTQTLGGRIKCYTEAGHGVTITMHMPVDLDKTP